MTDKTKNSFIEKRKYKRAKSDPTNPIEIQIMGFDGKGIIAIDILHAIDISEGGVAVPKPKGFDEFIQTGKSVDLLIVIPRSYGERTFTASGIIRRIGKAADGKDLFGVEFNNLSEKGRKLIREFVEQNG